MYCERRHIWECLATQCEMEDEGAVEGETKVKATHQGARRIESAVETSTQSRLQFGPTI